MKKIIITLSLLVLFGIFIVGCAEKTPATNKIIEPPVELSEWQIIKDYVLANHPISGNYFDSHFKFISVEYGTRIQGDYDYKKNEFSTLVPDVTVVHYEFTITDKDDQTHSFTDFSRIYLKDEKVIDSKDLPGKVSDYERSNFLSRSYDYIAPTRELKILLSKEDAINLAKNNPDCTNTEFFNVTKAEQDIKLSFVSGEVTWDWQDGLSYCKINAESGEIDSNLQLPD